MSDHITLYLTERRAFEAAERENADRINARQDAFGLRVISATMRDHDGSVDRGFKVLMVPPRGIGTPYYL